MPAVSKAQARFFRAMLSHPGEAKAKGISSKVAHEFVDNVPVKPLPERKRKAAGMAKAMRGGK